MAVVFGGALLARGSIDTAPDTPVAREAVKAPDFKLKLLSGETVRLSDFKGKKPISLVFIWGLPVVAKKYQPNKKLIAPATVTPVTADRRLDVKIGGMTCSGCVTSVGILLKEMSGVKTAKVDFFKGTAVVLVSDEMFKKEEMTAALKQLGYDAKIIGESKLN